MLSVVKCATCDTIQAFTRMHHACSYCDEKQREVTVIAVKHHHTVIGIQPLPKRKPHIWFQCGKYHATFGRGSWPRYFIGSGNTLGEIESRCTAMMIQACALYITGNYPKQA